LKNNYKLLFLNKSYAGTNLIPMTVITPSLTPNSK
jgi:hypothetical protein